MFGIRKKPKTKKLEDFELLDINLIKDLPIDYAYVMPQSNRVIQKRNKEELFSIVKKDLKSIKYIKVGPDTDFVPIESVVELKNSRDQLKRKKAKGGLIYSLILIFGFIGLIFSGVISQEFAKSQSLLAICIVFLVQIGFYIYTLLKIKGKV